MTAVGGNPRCVHRGLNGRLGRRAGLTLLGVVLAGGCASPGRLVARHAGDGPGHVAAAAEGGTYGLFVAGEGQPLTRVPVRAGQPLGFDVATDTATDHLRIQWLNAVAGDDRRRLDMTKDYEWRRL